MKRGADRIDAGLVVAAAVDVHDLGEQRQHRLLLRRQPVGDDGFLRCRLGHGSSPVFRASRQVFADPAGLVQAHRAHAISPQQRCVRAHGPS